MTNVVFSPRGRRGRCDNSTRKLNASVALVCAPLLTALALCVGIEPAAAEPHAVALIPDSESAVALIPAFDNAHL